MTSDGCSVIDRPNSHVHESVAELLPAAIGMIEANGQHFLVEEIDFGRIIGETVCVGTGPNDKIVYAQRPRRFGLSRFVKNRAPEPSSNIVIILMKAGDDDEYDYVLITAFVGSKPEREPWDQNATEIARAFWNSHALVWGTEPVLPGTETTTCPW